jgi:hypothetical protein
MLHVAMTNANVAGSLSMPVMLLATIVSIVNLNAVGNQVDQ